ncbi:MAG: hypothetical protein IGS03_18930 [Candidatus Sericytochromatia bacterium]|nr:hypothetical protein [Candidatus Sericytochromatia bacterium]
MKRIVLSLTAPVSLSLPVTLLSLPVEASVQRSADFDKGSSLGLGLFGVAYDYGWEFLSLGLSAASPNSTSNVLSTPLRLNTRVVARFYQAEGLSAAVLAGVTLDPGLPGSRAYLTPDLGLSIGYDFREFDAPFAVRLNLSLAISQAQLQDTWQGSQPASNFLQRLTFGPQTSLEVAWMPSDHLEFTAGGGTLLGMRLKFWPEPAKRALQAV